jgi:hemerythrin
MEKMSWSEDLSVGIDSIDDQHKMWIDKFNAVLDAIAAHQDQESIISTLAFLSDYTQEHFAAEEQFMTKTGYPGLEEHKAKHADLTATVDDMVRDFREDGVSQQLADATGTLLKNWLVKHIQEMDKQYASFSKEA